MFCVSERHYCSVCNLLAEGHHHIRLGKNKFVWLCPNCVILPASIAERVAPDRRRVVEINVHECDLCHMRFEGDRPEGWRDLFTNALADELTEWDVCPKCIKTKKLCELPWPELKEDSSEELEKPHA